MLTGKMSVGIFKKMCNQRPSRASTLKAKHNIHAFAKIDILWNKRVWNMFLYNSGILKELWQVCDCGSVLCFVCECKMHLKPIHTRSLKNIPVHHLPRLQYPTIHQLLSLGHFKTKLSRLVARLLQFQFSLITATGTVLSVLFSAIK